MKLPAAPLGGISAPLRPRLAGFPFHSNKLRGIKAELRRKPFTGFNWKLVTNLAQDNLDSMLKIVKSSVVAAHPKMLDPQKAGNQKT